MIEYTDRRTGRRIGHAHQTVCQHGKILRSGFPDPKTRYVASEVHRVLTDHPENEAYTCSDTCSRDRLRTAEAREKLEQYRQSCAECMAMVKR